ncbi:DUF11 domain-containing protein [Aggregatimonas sangjinii]|uniref:DUF11 domain-containing protein n=1 Tax=Aggregatimonas sangjinii TaxID=2583587 RepID=A0A5B7SWN1_9FLAO|nr:gliding motility-associated C-terminal domain-containing protein [Aggregatimonas sangjinii]QCX01170.1 DUF11 domain-containing protein [Aggregatimonas sangjinii]
MNLKKNACLLPSGNRRLYNYFLLLFFLFSFAAVQGQTMSISVPDNEGTEGTANDDITFRVRKSAGGLFASYSVTYTITTGAGNAVNGTDYTTLSGVVTVPGGGVTNVDITVEIIDDDLVEIDEEITITLDPPSPGSGYFVSGTANSATATIDDDDIGTFSLEVTEPNAAEEDEVRGRFIIRLDKVNATGQTISVPYTLSAPPTNGASPSDYTTTGQTVFTFPNEAQMARALNIIPDDDSEPESDEIVVLTLGTPEPTPISNRFVIATDANSGEVVIADNDCPAGDEEPDLNNNETDLCDVVGVDLNTYFDDTAPAGTALRWSTVEDPAVAAQLLTPAAASNAPADTYYAVFWSAAQTCASPSEGPLTITINQSPDAGTADTGLFSCNEAANGATEFDLDTALSGADAGGEWTKESGPGGNINVPNSGMVDFNNRPSGSYVFRYTLEGDGACDDDFEDVTISVSDCDPCIAGNVAPELDTTEMRIFCDDFTVNLNDYTNSVPPMGTALRWSLTAPTDDSVPNPIANPPIVNQRGTYYGYFYDSTNDCASPALQLVITQNTAPEIINAEGGTRCGEGPVTFSASSNSNATFNWYTAATGGAVLFEGANVSRQLNQTTTYYLEATENGCSTPRVPVTGTVLVQPSTGTAATGGSSCNNPAFGTTTLDLDTLLTDEDAGVWVYESGPENVPFDNQNIVDFNGRPNGNYVYTFTTSGAQAPCTNESVSLSISVSSCDTDDDGDGLLGGLEAILGTDPNDVDSDDDLINDDVEVGPETDNPLDQDDDGIIDALDSNLADSDDDGVVDQLDPANNNACIPDINNGNCDEPIDLEVIKTIDNPNAEIETDVVFTITVNNLGPRTAEEVRIGDLLESGFEYVSQSASAGAYDLDTGYWDFTDLEVGEAASLLITATVVIDENEMYSNTAQLLESSPDDSNPENDSSTVALGVEQPEGINLVVEKTARLGPDTQRLQQLTGLVNDIENTLTVEYFIKVTNKSEQGSIGNIRVRDAFEVDSLSSLTFEIRDTIPAPDGTDFNSTTGLWTINRSLEVDEEIELSYLVVFEGTGTVTNTAQIIAPQETDPEAADSTSSVTLEITTRNELEIGILYNQFSPNSDGINDVLKVNNLRKNELGLDEAVDINYSIDVYNRYGNVVYEASGLTEPEAWDGTWKGEQVPDGTYFYGLNVTVLNEGEPSETITSKGWIQLIR